MQYVKRNFYKFINIFHKDLKFSRKCSTIIVVLSVDIMPYDNIVRIGKGAVFVLDKVVLSFISKENISDDMGCFGRSYNFAYLFACSYKIGVCRNRL